MQQDGCQAELLRLGADALAQVALHLDCDDLVRLECCSKQLQTDLLSPAFSAVWRKHCEDYLGGCCGALVALSIPPASRSCAACWRRLCCDSRSMDTVHWEPSLLQRLTQCCCCCSSSSSSSGSSSSSSGSSCGGEDEDCYASSISSSSSSRDSCCPDPGCTSLSSTPGRTQPLKEQAGCSSSSSSSGAGPVPRSCRVEGEQLSSALSRHGHCVTPAGHLLVVTGGITVGAAGGSPFTEVLVLDLLQSAVSRPCLLGTAPASCYHHTATLIQPPADCPLAQQMRQAYTAAQSCQPPQEARRVPADKWCVAAGHTLLVYGGCDRAAQEQGSDTELQLLWLAPDGSWGAWLTVEATGEAPGPRAAHAAQPLRGGRQVVVYGGTVGGTMQGTVAHDVGVVKGYLLLSLYTLDVLTATWQKHYTWPLNEPPKPGHAMVGPSTCPGPRRSVLSATRVSPVTGVEELVVLGGCGTDGLADFVPYALDMNIFTWRKGPIMGHLPQAREQSTLLNMGRHWLLLVGGVTMGGTPVTHVERLDLHTLRWRAPARLLGQPGGGPQLFTSNAWDAEAASGSAGPGRSAAAAAAGPDAPQEGVPYVGPVVHGSSGTSGVLLGGMVPTMLGIAPAFRADLLLPGPGHGCTTCHACGLQAGPSNSSSTAGGGGAAATRPCQAPAGAGEGGSPQRQRLRITKEGVLVSSDDPSAWRRRSRGPAAAAAAGGSQGAGGDSCSGRSSSACMHRHSWEPGAGQGTQEEEEGPRWAVKAFSDVGADMSQLQQDQALTDTACHCGSCCECMAAKRQQRQQQEGPARQEVCPSSCSSRGCMQEEQLPCGLAGRGPQWACQPAAARPGGPATPPSATWLRALRAGAGRLPRSAGVQLLLALLLGLVAVLVVLPELWLPLSPRAPRAAAGAGL